MGQPVMQWQILSKNPEELTSFCAEMFGWSVNTDNALGYRTVNTETEKGIQGGVWPAPPEAHSAVTLYVEVEDVELAVVKATQLGASVIIPPQKLPDGDEMAVIVLPEGLPFGLMKRRG